MEMNDGRIVVGRIDALDLIPAHDGNYGRGIIVAVLQEPEVESRLYVARGEGDTIMPLDAMAKFPGHVHLVARDFDIAVFERRNLDGELGSPVVG